LPPIDFKKKLEVEARRIENEPYSIKRMGSARGNKDNHDMNTPTHDNVKKLKAD
jgi:hypothetical protein